MRRAYILNLYYNSIKAQAAKIAHMKRVVEEESRKQYRVLAYGEHICTIGFFTNELTGEAFSRDLGFARDEDFCYALFRIESMPAGFLYGDAAAWFQTELHKLALQKGA